MDATRTSGLKKMKKGAAIGTTKNTYLKSYVLFRKEPRKARGGTPGTARIKVDQWKPEEKEEKMNEIRQKHGPGKYTIQENWVMPNAKGNGLKFGKTEAIEIE